MKSEVHLMQHIHKEADSISMTKHFAPLEVFYLSMFHKKFLFSFLLLYIFIDLLSFMIIKVLFMKYPSICRGQSDMFLSSAVHKLTILNMHPAKTLISLKPTGIKSNSTCRLEHSVVPNQHAFKMPADLDLYSYQNRIAFIFSMVRFSFVYRISVSS